MTRKQRRNKSSLRGEGGPGGNQQGDRRALSLAESFRYAWAGVCYWLSSQRNARIHMAVAVVVLTAGVIVGLSSLEMAVIVTMVAIVLTAEMFNTAIEAAIDLATEEWCPLAKVAKDLSAAAVLVTAIAAVVVGLVIFLPHLLSLAAALTQPS